MIAFDVIICMVFHHLITSLEKVAMRRDRPFAFEREQGRELSTHSLSFTEIYESESEAFPFSLLLLNYYWNLSQTLSFLYMLLRMALYALLNTSSFGTSAKMTPNETLKASLRHLS